MYLRFVFLIAKTSQMLVQRLGRGGGTALPGLIAERLSHRLLFQLAAQLQGTIVVVGTNGKTTTSRLIASYLEGDGCQIVHNRSGSNLVRGVLSSLIAQADWQGHIDDRWGLFEIDEAVLPQILPSLSPDYLVALNLFRDQLDRYGEVDTIAAKWRTACQKLSDKTTLILNADDPLIASLAAGSQANTLFFGVDFDSGPPTIEAYADSRHCPLCGSPLRFSRINYSHLGVYRCPTGDFERPEPTVSANKVRLNGMEGSQFSLVTAQVSTAVDLGLAGLYNVYNVTAAMAMAVQLGLPMAMLVSKTRHFQAVFGRLEKISIGDMTLVLVLVKNPTGFNQVVQTVTSDAKAHSFWLILNDKLADGRDVSWIWDTQLEKLEGQVRSLLVSGTRALDMALRGKYAGLSITPQQVSPSISEGLRSLTGAKADTIYCLCTYTAMLELRQLLQKRHTVRSYHDS
jgi:UDP-N-acetylmuramyl tripeptide synthase